jgi:hypothetical protein
MLKGCGVLSRYKKGGLTADWDPEMARSNYRVVQLPDRNPAPPALFEPKR